MPCYTSISTVTIAAARSRGLTRHLRVFALATPLSPHLQGHTTSLVLRTPRKGMKPLGSSARGAANTFFLGSAIILPWATLTIAQTLREQALVPARACADFSYEAAGDGDSLSSTSSSPWRLSDCVDVWSAWSRTIPVELRRGYPDQQLLRESAADMRRRGERRNDEAGG